MIWCLSNGAIAQLGERLICIQEVVGSIPSGSTRSCVPCPVSWRFAPRLVGTSRARIFEIVKREYIRLCKVTSPCEPASAPQAEGPGVFGKQCFRETIPRAGLFVIDVWASAEAASIDHESNQVS